MPVLNRNSADLRTPRFSGRRRVFAAVFALSAVTSALLWSAEARRPTRDDLFGPVLRTETSNTADGADGSDVGRRNDREPPIWVESETRVWMLQLSPDDKYLAAGVGRAGEHFSTRVLLIERRSGAVLVETPAYFRVRTCFTAASDALLVYTPDTYPFTLETRGVVSVYSVVDGTKTNEIDVTGPGRWQDVEAISVSGDGRTLAILPGVKTPESRKAWDLDSRQSVAFKEGAYHWYGAGLSPNGELYSMGGWPGPGVRIRRFGSSELVSFCLRDALPAVGSSLSDDNRFWATAYDDGAFVVWDIRERQNFTGVPLVVKAGFDHCTAFALSHDLTQIAYAEDDGTIRMQPLQLP
jgi:hypothetical protein